MCTTARARLLFPLLSLGLAACGDPAVILPETLGIVAFAPSHGAVGIDPQVAAAVVFSHPLPADAPLDLHLRLERVAPVQELVVALSLSEDRYAVLLDPQDTLAPANSYRLWVGAGLAAEDPDVRPLPVDVAATFTTSP